MNAKCEKMKNVGGWAVRSDWGACGEGEGGDGEGGEGGWGRAVTLRAKY